MWQPLRTFAATAGAVVVLVLTAASQTQIHPPTGGAEGPIVIAVLSDHFMSGEEAEFDLAAKNFILHGLLADPDYAPYANSFTVKTFFDPWTPSPQTPASNYGFEIATGVSNCSIAWKGDTTNLIESIVGGIAPFGTIVIGKYGYVFGCTERPWTYVTTGAVGLGLLEHEGGHLFAELFDEYVAAGLESTSYPGTIFDRNCSTKLIDPHWKYWALTPAPNNVAGCDRHGVGIIRGYHDCRMGAFGRSFCEVCGRAMPDAFGYFSSPDTWNPEPPSAINPETSNPPTPPADLRVSGAGLLIQPTPPQPPPPQGVQPILRILVNLNRLTNAATVQRGTNANGRFVPSYRRLGEYVYEVSEAGKTLAMGVLPGDPFRVHDYRGSPQRHQAPQVDTATIVVPIPGESIQSLLAAGRSVQIDFYRLAPSVQAPVIRPGLFNELKASKQLIPVAQIAPAVLRNALL